MEEEKSEVKELRFLSTKGTIPFEVIHEFTKGDLKQLSRIGINVNDQEVINIRIAAEIILRRVIAINNMDTDKARLSPKEKLLTRKERELFTGSVVVLNKIIEDIEMDIVHSAKRANKSATKETSLIIPQAGPETEE